MFVYVHVYRCWFSVCRSIICFFNCKLNISFLKQVYVCICVCLYTGLSNYAGWLGVGKHALASTYLVNRRHSWGMAVGRSRCIIGTGRVCVHTTTCATRHVRTRPVCNAFLCVWLSQDAWCQYCQVMLIWLDEFVLWLAELRGGLGMYYAMTCRVV